MKTKIYIFLTIFFLLIILIITRINAYKPYSAWKKLEEKTTPKIIMFLGDSITQGGDFKSYFDDLLVVNKGKGGDKASKITNRLEKNVYPYNPNKIFLLIGINDIKDKKTDNKTIATNIDNIIKEIKKHCPNTTIYLESIYPINNTNNKKIDHNYFKYCNNDDVIKVNKEIKEIAKNNNIKYIDIHSILKDENNNLKLSLTKEGLHLNKDGYKVVFDSLKEYVYE